MPNDNIKRMLDKGNQSNVSYEANTYEGYGPSGIAVICETLTDNRNRTVADVRHYFDKYGAGLGNAGCVSWQFEQKGVLIIERGDLDEDETMMTVLDAGADDFPQAGKGNLSLAGAVEEAGQGGAEDGTCQCQRRYAHQGHADDADEKGADKGFQRTQHDSAGDVDEMSHRAHALHPENGGNDNAQGYHHAHEDHAQKLCV